MPEPHERARALIGVPFRPQGRDPRLGLDCIGLVICAYKLNDPPLPRYRLTDGSWELVERELSVWFKPVKQEVAGSNDLAVYQLRRTFHFGVIGGKQLIHADAMIGRVTARRLPLLSTQNCRFFRYIGDDPWPILS